MPLSWIDFYTPDPDVDSAANWIEPVVLGKAASAADNIAPTVLEFGVEASGGAALAVPPDWEIGYSGVDMITIRFSEDVIIFAESLSLTAAGREAGIVGFNYDSVRHVATWQLDQSLTEGSWQLVLDDTVSDLAGNRLDGENRGSLPSGNGRAGGDFRAQLSVVPGDLNADGETSLSDFGMLWEHIGASAAYDIALDVNLDGQLDALDLDAICDNFGANASAIDPARQVLTVSLDDWDGDTVPDFAILQDGEDPMVYLTSLGAAAAAHSISLNANYDFFDIEPVFAGGVAIALAIAGTSETTGGVRVWLIDLATASLSPSLYVGQTLAMTDMDAWQSADGHIKIGLAGEVLGRSQARIVLADFTTGQTVQKNVASNYVPIALEFVQDASGEQLLVAGNTSTGGVRLFGYAADTLLRNLSITFGKAWGVDLQAIHDPASGLVRYGLLSTSPGQPGAYRVDLRAAGGQLLESVTLISERQAQEFALWLGLDDNAIHFSVLEIGEADRFASVSSGSLGGSDLFQAPAGAGSITDSFAMFQAADGMSFALGQRNPVTGAEQVRMRSAEANMRLPTFAVPGAPLDDGWFEGERVHGHTRYFVWDPERGTEFYDLPGSTTAGASFAALGAHVFTRSVRHYDDTPAWSSEVPLDALGDQILAGPRTQYGHDLGALENLIQPMVNESWSSGTPMIAYFNDMSDAMLAELHPEWVVHNYGGTPATHPKRGVFLDITGPFGEIVLQRLLELADMGVAGIYLDYTHLPLNGAWGSQIEEAWIAQTGAPAPPIGFTEEYRDFVSFGAQRMTDTIAGWEAALQVEYPGLELIVSVTSLTGLTRLDMNSYLADIGNPKNEFFTVLSRQVINRVFENNPDLYQPDDAIRQAFGLVLLRDNSENGTPHIWKARSPTAEQDEAFIAAVAAFGGIAALDIIEYMLEPGTSLENLPGLEDYAANFEFGARLSPFLENATPHSNVAIYWSEAARDAWYVSGDAASWANVNLPALGAFEALLGLGLTPTILTDGSISSGIGAEIDLVFVPDLDSLSFEQLAELARFADAGGTVMTGDGTDWSTEAGYQSGVAGVAAAAAPLVDDAEIRIDNLPDRAMVQTYRSTSASNPLIVAITNSFTHVQASRLDDPILPADVLLPPDPVPAGVSIFVADSALPPGAAMPYAYDAVSGAMLVVSASADGWIVTLPEFAQMSLIVIERPVA